MARTAPETVKVYVDPTALRETVGQPGAEGLSPDAMQLLLVAEASDRGYVDLVTSAEALNKTGGAEHAGLFFGASLGHVTGTDIPLCHGTGQPDPSNGSDAPRFGQLRDIFLPAEDEERARFKAYYLLRAEENRCEALLSCDEGFRTRARETDIAHVPVVGPGELLEAVGNRIGRWATIKFLLGGRRRIRDARAQLRQGSNRRGGD